MANFPCKNDTSCGRGPQLSLSIGDADIDWIAYFPTVITGTAAGLLFTVFVLELKVTANITVIFRSVNDLIQSLPFV